VNLSRPHGSVTPSGFVQQLDGMGMPYHDDPSEHGKLFVEYSVVFPVGREFSVEETEGKDHVASKKLGSLVEASCHRASKTPATTRCGCIGHIGSFRVIRLKIKSPNVCAEPFSSADM
jgi:hypothetical protein